MLALGVVLQSLLLMGLVFAAYDQAMSYQGDFDVSSETLKCLADRFGCFPQELGQTDNVLLISLLFASNGLAIWLRTREAHRPAFLILAFGIIAIAVSPIFLLLSALYLAFAVRAAVRVFAA